MELRLAVLIALAIVAALVVAACSSERRRSARAAATLARPATKEALISRALRALRANDPSAYVELMATVSEVTRACPGRFEQRKPGKLRAKWQRQLARTREQIARCNKLIDFKKARKIATTGGGPRAPVAKCKEKVVRLHDVYVTYQAGDRRYRIRLAKPYVRNDAIYGFARGPSCQLER